MGCHRLSCFSKLKTNYAAPAGVYKDIMYDQHYTGILT